MGFDCVNSLRDFFIYIFSSVIHVHVDVVGGEVFKAIGVVLEQQVFHICFVTLCSEVNREKGVGHGLLWVFSHLHGYRIVFMGSGCLCEILESK